jgi:hypothetical protein
MNTLKNDSSTTTIRVGDQYYEITADEERLMVYIQESKAIEQGGVIILL